MQVFEQVGGFDARLGAGSRFPAADDNDLGFRLLKAGYEIVYAPEPVVYHRAWRPASEYLSDALALRAGQRRVLREAPADSEPRYMAGRIVRDIGRRALASSDGSAGMRVARPATLFTALAWCWE